MWSTVTYENKYYKNVNHKMFPSFLFNKQLKVASVASILSKVEIRISVQNGCYIYTNRVGIYTLLYAPVPSNLGIFTARSVFWTSIEWTIRDDGHWRHKVVVLWHIPRTENQGMLVNTISTLVWQWAVNHMLTLWSPTPRISPSHIWGKLTSKQGRLLRIGWDESFAALGIRPLIICNTNIISQNTLSCS